MYLNFDFFVEWAFWQMLKSMNIFMKNFHKIVHRYNTSLWILHIPDVLDWAQQVVLKERILTFNETKGISFINVIETRLLILYL